MKVNPIKGKWRAENMGLEGVGGKISVLISISSTSKWLVSVGLDTSGIYGATLSLIVSQSIPINQLCSWKWWLFEISICY